MSWLSSVSHKSHKTIWRVDSAGVSVSIVSETENGVLYYDFQPINFFADDDRHRHDQLMHHTELLITRMCSGLVSFLKTPPNNTVVVLGEPWTHTIRRQIVYKRKTAFTITHAFINDLVDRDIKRVALEYKKTFGDEIDLIPPTHHDLLIAGHVIDNPWGNTVNDIRLTYSTGYSDPTLVALIKILIHEKTKARLISIQFDQYQNYVMRFLKKISFSNGVIIDMSGFISDVYIFQNNALIQAGTLPVGVSEIKKRLSYELGIYPTELESLFQLYKKNLLDDKMMRKIQNELQKIFFVWEQDFQKFCHNAVIHGDILDQVIWIGDQYDYALEYWMNNLSRDKVSFPVIFGSTQVGFIHSDTILNALEHIYDLDGIQNQDKIILTTLNK